ncbi:MAG: hypothetical protein FJ280_25135, partial [Planctomycetes bacterium]|nr:hypothetical protein [Planctomycetota bacterium]
MRTKPVGPQTGQGGPIRRLAVPGIGARRAGFSVGSRRVKTYDGPHDDSEVFVYCRRCFVRVFAARASVRAGAPAPPGGVGPGRLLLRVRGPASGVRPVYPLAADLARGGGLGRAAAVCGDGFLSRRRGPAVAMRVLGISASPRREGNSDLLLHRALEGAAQAGGATEFLRLCDYRLAACRECYGCAATGDCAVHDDYQPLLAMMLAAD